VNQAIAIAPDQLSYFVRAEIYRAQGNLPKAVEDYTRAHRLDPNTPEFLQRRADMYEQLGKTDEANADREAAQHVLSGENELTEARQFLQYLQSNGVKLKIARNKRDLEPSGTRIKPETLDKIKRLKPQLLQILAGE